MVIGAALSATVTPETVVKATGQSLELRTLADRKERIRHLAAARHQGTPAEKVG